MALVDISDGPQQLHHALSHSYHSLQPRELHLRQSLHAEMPTNPLESKFGGYLSDISEDTDVLGCSSGNSIANFTGCSTATKQESLPEDENRRYLNRSITATTAVVVEDVSEWSQTAADLPSMARRRVTAGGHPHSFTSSWKSLGRRLSTSMASGRRQSYPRGNKKPLDSVTRRSTLGAEHLLDRQQAPMQSQQRLHRRQSWLSSIKIRIKGGCDRLVNHQQQLLDSEATPIADQRQGIDDDEDGWACNNGQQQAEDDDGNVGLGLYSTAEGCSSPYPRLRSQPSLNRSTMPGDCPPSPARVHNDVTFVHDPENMPRTSLSQRCQPEPPRKPTRFLLPHRLSVSSNAAQFYASE